MAKGLKTRPLVQSSAAGLQPHRRGVFDGIACDRRRWAVPDHSNLGPIRQIAAHELVLDQIRRSMDAGQFRPGDRLPPERDRRSGTDNLAALRRFRGERPEALLAYLKIVACNVARDHARLADEDRLAGGNRDAKASQTGARPQTGRVEPGIG